MTVIVALYLAVTSAPTPSEVNAFWKTAPHYLTPQTAAWHLIAARAAGYVHHIRPELLLAIAHHESRYIPTTRTAEPGHRESCGVMTPIPKRRCNYRELTILGGYDIGAAHLRVWMNHYHNIEYAALTAYAGGGRLVHVCRRGPWQTSHGTDACMVQYEFRQRARVISNALRGVPWP